MIHSKGPLLTVDVGERDATETSIDDVLEAFIGGRGVSTKLAHDRIDFDADPLGPENSLFFATGPLQTSMMSFTGRMNATAVSPLTDGLLSSNAGGYMSRPFADTGYSAVEITGASDELIGLHVTDEGVEFEEVPDLEGADVPTVTEYIEEEHGLGSDHTAVIGPAGENEVRFASIMTSKDRAFGRGGLGAVLGSKNVKFLAVDGDSRPEIDLPDEVTAAVHKEASTADNPMKESGTVSVSGYANKVGALPTKYFQELSWDKVDEIGAQAVAEHKYKKGTCSSCAFACKLPTRDEETGFETEGPEYETMMAFGTNALVDDFLDLMKSNDLCNRYGLDTISAGDAIAAYLAAEDEFGNAELIHDLIEKVAHREGVGDTLADGIDAFHDELGVENWTQKGMEFPAHDGRTLNGQGLSFAVSNRGADHMYAEMYHYEYPLVGPDRALDPEGVEGKSPRLVEAENRNAVKDSGVLCKFAFSFVDEERMEKLFQADWEDIMDVGHRIVTLERHFNNERGVDREDDLGLPYDLDGLEDELENYYAERNWNDDGTVPDSLVGSGDSGAAPADD